MAIMAGITASSMPAHLVCGGKSSGRMLDRVGFRTVSAFYLHLPVRFANEAAEA